jgi:hypothetical protein
MSMKNSKHIVDRNLPSSELQEALGAIAKAIGKDMLLVVGSLDAASLEHERLEDDLADVASKYCSNVQMLNDEISLVVRMMSDQLDSALDALSIKYGADAIGEALLDHPSQLADIQMADSAIDRLRLFCELTDDQMNKCSLTRTKQLVHMTRARKKVKK